MSKEYGQSVNLSSEGNAQIQVMSTMPAEISRMDNHIEGMIHLNEKLEFILSKLIGQQSCDGENAKQLEPSGLLDAISSKNSQIDQQVHIAHDYASRITEML